jgi:hypothetical protein
MKYIVVVAAFLMVNACSKDPGLDDAFTRLKSVTYYLQSSNGDFRQGEKIEYTYLSGKLDLEIQSEYDVTTQTFKLFSTTNYIYKDGKVDAIVKQISGLPNKVTTRYEYNGGKVSRIIRDDEVDTDATIKYLAGDTVAILYSFSNGRFFNYRFKSKNENVVYEQTFDEDRQLTSETSTDYDSRKNPFRLLGYTDLLFSNYSANNKIKTVASYYGGAFPTLTPVSYEYEYNSLNYPISQITTYKSSGSGAMGKSKTVFEYN